MSAKSILTVLTIVSSFAMRLSPFPDFYWVHKHKKIGEVQLLPVVALMNSSASTAIYAVVIGDFVPLFATNTFGVFVSMVFVLVFHHYTQDHKYVYKVCGTAAAVFALLLLYAILGATGVTHESHSEVSRILGSVTIVMTTVLFMSPLATIKHVLKTKNAASIPFTLCLMNTINAALWLAYAIVVSDWFVAAPNFLGVPLGITQVTLYLVYRPSKLERQKGLTVLPTDVTIARDSIPAATPQPKCDSHRRILSNDSGNDVFVEMLSPRKA